MSGGGGRRYWSGQSGIGEGEHRGEEVDIDRRVRELGGDGSRGEEEEPDRSRAREIWGRRDTDERERGGLGALSRSSASASPLAHNINILLLYSFCE